MKKMIATLCLVAAAACGVPYEGEEELATLKQGVLTDRQIDHCRSLINRALAARDVEAARHFYARCMEAAGTDRERGLVRDLDPDRADRVADRARTADVCRDTNRCPENLRR